MVKERVCDQEQLAVDINLMHLFEQLKAELQPTISQREKHD